ncbi:YXWGXW repeat-containing protein [Massilia sp. H-1]|nr:YXWGXW repeat-containing protein [Massilia sp. H-1]
MKRTLTFAAAIALGAAALMPLSASAQIGVNLYVDTAPPAPRYESIPAPRSGYVWAPGFWNWEGNRHVWIVLATGKMSARAIASSAPSGSATMTAGA